MLVLFKPDGTSFHLFDVIGNDVRKFSLTTAWDISTATEDTSQAMDELMPNATNGTQWNNDGSKLIAVGNHGTSQGQNIFTLNLNTSYDAASTFSIDYSTYFPTGTGVGKVFQTSIDGGAIGNIRFNNDGTKVYWETTSTIGRLYEAPLSTAWDISTIGSITNSGSTISSQLTGYNTTFDGYVFNPDGTKLYVADFDFSGSPNLYYIREFSLSTAFDISTLSYSTGYSWTSTISSQPASIDISPDGTHGVMMLKSTSTNYVLDLSTGWDFSTLTATLGFSNAFSNGDIPMLTEPRSSAFNHDGTKFYTVDRGSNIYEFKLATAYDTSTVVTTDARVAATQDELGVAPGGVSIAFSSDGSKMFYSSDHRIYSYSVPNGTTATSTSDYTATAVITDQSLSGSTSVNLNNIPDYDWIVVEIEGPASSTGGGNVGAYLRIDTTNASYSTSDYTVSSLYSIGSPYEISGKYMWSAPVGNTIDDWIAFNPLKAKIIQANGYLNGSYETNYTNEYAIASHVKAKSIQIYNPYGTTFNAGRVSVTVYSKNS